ncbi:arylsulfatase (aryl-sulfate sulphohydrolase) [Lentisphaera araneosa HTCC2155]|uniref:Arylsulfatase (Aryl-sulfate sulphohydrolase) n=1 Tax=Lentisphaera araneosa HTCC2155 TaxID=313628 RepID=A6DTP6_9BACT|nr:arylsulfatase [Lentisphaera araneosa]EDM24973.1 arylsulfatase (aryl-sulfate sulphohydrolase) [Lentisphaera araneosa HTCC2155]
MNKYVALLLVLISTTLMGQKQNVILILVDDLGYSDLSSYGGEIQTPAIDSLGAKGIKMTQLYNSARCCPTRASLLTGLYSHKTGVGFMTKDQGKPGYRGFLNDKCMTIASVLKGAGYKTYLAGKWHLKGLKGQDCLPTSRGFDRFYGPFHDYADFYMPELYHSMPEKGFKVNQRPGKFFASNAITDYALSFLNEARQEEKPYFLYLAYNAPHFPLQAPKDLIDKYVPTYEKGWDKLRQERLQKMKDLGLVNQALTLPERGLVAKVDNRNKDSKYYGKQIPAWKSLDSDRQKDLARRMATFAAMVENVDQNIALVLSDLKKNNELENTVIFFLSDNGACAEWDPHGFDDNPYPKNKLYKADELAQVGQEKTFHSYGTGWANLGNTPLQSYKHYSYEGGISSPFIMYAPQFIKAKKGFDHSPAHVMDLAPTIYSTLGATYPKEFKGIELYPLQGKSLLEVLKKDSPERVLYFEHEGNRAIRQGQWKAVWVNYKKVWELYNINEDRLEQNDLAAKMPELVTELSKKWLDWAEENFVELQKMSSPSSKMPTVYYRRK